MGISFGTLTKIFLGIGLGILATSCLTITILFGQYADKGFTNLEKQIAKIESSYLYFPNIINIYSYLILMTY